MQVTLTRIDPLETGAVSGLGDFSAKELGAVGRLEGRLFLGVAGVFGRVSAVSAEREHRVRRQLRREVCGGEG